MIKLNREYSLKVQRVDGTFQVFELPYTIEFDVDRHVYSSPNEATIKIYNLSPDSRNQLRKDVLDTDKSRRVTLQVGYGGNMSTIFDGTLDQCWSGRQGVNFITNLKCRDNGFIYSNTFVSVAYSDGESKQSVINKIIKQMESAGIQRGIVGNIEGSYPIGRTIEGLASDLLRTVTGDIAFIDNNRVYVLNDDEALIGDYTEITSDTGLLNTPILENAYVRCDILLEPRLVVGQKIKLNSQTASEGYTVSGATYFGEFKNKAQSNYHYSVTNFNGDYKVIGIRHSGTISATVAGSAVTSVTLGGEYIKTAYKGISIG
jgi:hypothetical protein